MVNREIKFRAWTGDLNAHWGSKPQMIYWFPVPAHKHNDPEARTRMILDNWLLGDRPVMQYIGIKDIDGQEVFEGDLVIDTDEPDDYYEVKYFGDQDYPGFDLSPDMDTDSNAISYLAAQGQLKVIGNIYENKDLVYGR